MPAGLHRCATHVPATTRPCQRYPQNQSLHLSCRTDVRITIANGVVRLWRVSSRRPARHHHEPVDGRARAGCRSRRATPPARRRTPRPGHPESEALESETPESETPPENGARAPSTERAPREPLVRQSGTEKPRRQPPPRTSETGGARITRPSTPAGHTRETRRWPGNRRPSRPRRSGRQWGSGRAARRRSTTTPR